MKQRFRGKLARLTILIIAVLLFLHWLSSQKPLVHIGADQAAFAPNGHRVAFISWQGVQIWDSVTGKQTLLTDTLRGAIFPESPRSPLAWHPSGTYLALPGEHMQVDIWSTRENLRITGLSGTTKPITQLAFSPDGSQLAVEDRDGLVSLWRWEDQTLLWKQQIGSGHFLVFNPTGDRLFTASGTYNVHDGSTVTPYPMAFPLFNGCMAVEPRHALIATCDVIGEVELFDLKQGQLQQTFRALDGAAHSVAFSPDGRYIAVGKGQFEFNQVASNAITVFDLQTGQEVWHLPAGTITQVYHLQFSSDGRQLLMIAADAPLLIVQRMGGSVWELPAP